MQTTKETFWTNNQSQAWSLVFLNIRNKVQMLDIIAEIHYSINLQ